MSEMPDASGASTVRVLREAAEWRAIGLLFECPRDGWHTELSALIAELANSELQEAVAVAQREASEGLYHTTFGPGGPAAPREVSYRDSLLAGQTLGQLRGLYETFAYRPTIPEPPDHVAVMAGFVSYLRCKEAYALLNGENEQAATAAAAAARFIADHLSVIAEPLAPSLALSGTRYLELAARVLVCCVVGKE